VAALLYRIGRFAYRRRWIVLVAWLAILVGAFGADKAFSGTTSDSFSIPGIEAQQAMNTSNADFKTAAGVGGNLVFQAPSGQKVTAAHYEQAIDTATAEAAHVPGVKKAVSPFAGKTISTDGTTAYTSITFDATSASGVSSDAQKQLAQIATQASHSGLTVAAGGNAAESGSPGGGGGSTELIGVLFALLVLAIAFRSLVAAFLPLATALMAVGIGTTGLMALSGVFSMSSSAPILGSMLGLAVGIDYSLFIVSRHQNQVRGGMDPEESAARSVATSGSAVIFAGATVVVALSALFVVNIPFLTVMGLGAAGTVVVAVLVAVTLLPALLGFMGPRITRSRIFRRSAPHPESGRTLGARWVRGVTGRRLRWPAAAGVVVALLVLAAPSLKMQLGLPQDQQGSAAQAATMISDGFGKGYNGPLMILVTGESQQQVQQAAQQEASHLGTLPDVQKVGKPVMSKTADAALINVIPSSGPNDQATTDLVNSIRSGRGTLEQSTGTTIDVTGQTAINIDLSAKLANALPKYALTVVVVAMIILLLVFRSIAVPLKAMAGFVLSAFAALGATVAAFQWGWLASAFGVQSGQLLSILPTMLLGILFGLAMDYEVFLVSRMREEYVHGAEPGAAVRGGFANSARVVTAAALIMISVFTSFIASNEQMIKPMAFAFAIGVFCDAFLVRMTLVPALLAALGRAAWWLPGWLARIVPRVDIEGAALRRAAAPADAAEGAQGAGGTDEHALVPTP
jgi:RND superfamily putative drug exporter